MIELDLIVQAGVRGAIVGLGNGLLAVAVVVTFRSTGVLNLALGGVASIAAFVLSTLWGVGSVPLVIALPVALCVAAGVGVAGERIVRPLRSSTLVVKAVASLGLLLVLQAVADLTWGSGDRFLPLLIQGSVGVGSLRVLWQQLLAAAFAVGAAVALSRWTRSRPSGMATLAIAENRDAAELLGIRPDRVAVIVWAISAVLAGLAGILLSGFTVLNTTEMTLALITSLAAALLAGFDDVAMAVGAAAAVGSTSAMAATIPAISEISGVVESLGFIAVMVVIVLVRPRITAAQLERA